MRALMIYLFDNVPLGPLAPWVLGLILGRRPVAASVYGPFLVVKCRMVTTYSDAYWKGSGYCEDQRMVQQLVLLEARRFLWWRWWHKTVLDEEEVPSAVWISEGAFGENTTGWRSKFADVVDAQKKCVRDIECEVAMKRLDDLLDLPRGSKPMPAPDYLI